MPGLTSAEWKSSECGRSTFIAFVEPLVSVKSTVSPSLTTIGVDTPVPRWYFLPLTAKLHTSVGARSLETWVTCWKTSTSNFLTAPAGHGGSVGSTRSNGSNSTPSASASVGAAAAAAGVAGAVAAGAAGLATTAVDAPPDARLTSAIAAAMIATSAVSPTAMSVHSRRPSAAANPRRGGSRSAGCRRLRVRDGVGGQWTSWVTPWVRLLYPECRPAGGPVLR